MIESPGKISSLQFLLTLLTPLAPSPVRGTFLSALHHPSRSSAPLPLHYGLC
jgi:hypothetical protein